MVLLFLLKLPVSVKALAGVLTLSQTLNFRLFQIVKQYADDNFKFNENVGKFSEWIENAVGKEEIAHHE